MTRETWYEETASDLWDLISFCNDNGYDGDVCDIIHEDDIDGEICQEIRDATHDQTWEEISDALDSIPRGSDWYRHTGQLTYEEFTDEDFERLRDDIADCLENNGYFTYDDDEEDDDDEDNYGESDEWDRCEPLPQPPQVIGIEQEVQFLF